jgi:hypothetical protein
MDCRTCRQMCLLTKDWKWPLRLRVKSNAIFTEENNTDVHITPSKQSHVLTIANGATND